MTNLCPICSEKIKTIATLECAHKFCEECIKKWFENKKSCPVCRTDSKMFPEIKPQGIDHDFEDFDNSERFVPTISDWVPPTLGMGNESLMQLVAFGYPVWYLTGNQEMTFFNINYQHYANWPMEAIEHQMLPRRELTDQEFENLIDMTNEALFLEDLMRQ